MPYDLYKDNLPDAYPDETAEWLAAIDDVAGTQGRARARYLLHRLFIHARQRQIDLPNMVSTDYINTISPEQEPYYPGDEALEFRIRQLIRWNAAVMVIRANKLHVGLGGHLATYASAAGLYEVGFNHFFRGKDHPGGGDQVWIQGHAAPGIYARGYLEGRIAEQQLEHFRREAAWKGGLSSYPHPRLMPDFWEFPSVSMGLAPITAIYQARFNRYLHQRGIKDTSQQRVWAFVGDGEMDEPESVGALHLAANEPLDNLIFVVNCNLQRLDGPVRGNGKIIQELESLFRGAGWHVIKVIWGREWDVLLAKDHDGALVNKMNTTPDGEFQRYSIESGGYIREQFFGEPRLRRMVQDLSDDQIWRLKRGGHDYRKVFAAYRAATEVNGKPVVILAKTVKGWALGPEFEARNAAHQIKKMNEQELSRLAERLEIEVSAKKLSGEEPPFFHPGEDSDEVHYLNSRRKKLGGYVPHRKVRPKPLPLPGDDLYRGFDAGTESANREVSTTMAFVALLKDLMKDRVAGPRIVPIIPDEGRTFGLESLFKEFNIHSSVGQLYEPVDYNMLLSYSEKVEGQILEEGITEAGSMGSFTAAGTAYASHGLHMIPFFLFYSMFGWQRIGDLIWAFGDARGRGFLLGCTAGRTTLNGEGLQHADGHSLLVSSTMPNCYSYDPAFAYETAAIVRDGLDRMIRRGEDIFYYLALYNENYPMPAKPEGVDEGILKGIYRFRPSTLQGKHRVQLLGSGPILATQVLRAQTMLEEHDVAADVWSVTSFKLLRQDALSVERWNRLHPEESARVPYIGQAMAGVEGPVIAATDWMKAVPDQVARWVPGPFVPLGTDGFGRSDTRENLRRRFEVDAEHIVVAALAALALTGEVKPEAVGAALQRYGLDPEAAEAGLE
ncbi:MAG: pyruvate dehydrogenase (acetyl-transferring), homodimeric type [Actinomycetota bacterium]